MQVTTLTRPSLESATLVTLAFEILAVAGASSWSVDVRNVAHPARTGGLVALCLLALAYAAQRRGMKIPRPRIEHVVVSGFLLLAAVSISWSVEPRETVVRAGAFGLLIVAAAAIGIGASHDGRAARRILLGVPAAAVLVALVGVAIYAVSPDDALQPATPDTGARFRGLGENPNTDAMLFAAALPTLALIALEARSVRQRVGSAVTFLLLAVLIGFSGSRGAMVAATAGILVFGWCVARRPSWRAAMTAAAALLAAALVGLGSLTDPLSAGAAEAETSPPANVEPSLPNDQERVLRLEDEVGDSSGGSPPRRLLSASGRLDAWRSALEQGGERPLLGYGFGTEETVFVDRFRGFQGGVPENSFIGIFLQLGVVGVVLLCGLILLLARRAVRGLQTDRGIAAACIGVLTAGIALALVQSYIYAIGSVATLAVWLAAFLAPSRSADRLSFTRG